MSIVEEFNLDKIEEGKTYELYEGSYSSDEEIERKLKLAGYKYITEKKRIYVTKVYADELEHRIAVLDSGNVRIWEFESEEYYQMELEHHQD